MPRSTVSRWLQRLGLNQLASVPVAPVQRYEWLQAGDTVYSDAGARVGVRGAVWDLTRATAALALVSAFY
jgi:hypothetical protein